MADWTDNFMENSRRLKSQGAPPPAAAVVPITRNGDHNAYVGAAHTSELSELATCPNGSRNHALNIVALKLARLPIDRDQLRNDLIQACHTNGLIRDDGRRSVEATIGSAFAKADRDGPRELPEHPVARPKVIEVSAGQLGGDNVDMPDMHPIWGAHRPIDAAHYLFDDDDTAVCLWGDDERILWAEGESLMIAGGMGLGKTTLAGQIIRAQLGLDDNVLGLPVSPAGGPILYLAMDRPRQIRRSMLRQFDPAERHMIAQRFLIRPGPPVADVAARPSLFAEMAAEVGAAILYVDSLKDAAIGLSSDEVGAAYNRARQYALANGCQLCELHHLIKRNPFGGSPNSVADVYGSNWLTAGAGSVVMLTGEPGDPIVEFRHAKQPHAEVGPWRLLHDQGSGRFNIEHEVDLLALAAVSGANGLTPQGAAAAIFEKDKPSRAQVEKARRRLDRLVAGGKLVRVEGMKGGVSGGVSANYFTVA
jgi:hypothetical protein